LNGLLSKESPIFSKLDPGRRNVANGSNYLKFSICSKAEASGTYIESHKNASRVSVSMGDSSVDVPMFATTSISFFVGGDKELGSAQLSDKTTYVRSVDGAAKTHTKGTLEALKKMQNAVGKAFGEFECWMANVGGVWKLASFNELNNTGNAKELDDAAKLATKVGASDMPTLPDKRYTLLVTSEFFANGELRSHQEKYGDRFELDSVSGATDEQFVNNVLTKAKGIETRTVVLVPDTMKPDQLERLTKAGIRFVQTNASALAQAKTDASMDGAAYRASFQINTYAIMLLVRSINDSMKQDSALYRLLEFYIKSHFDLTDKVAVSDYIQAIMKGDVSRLIKGVLAYKPAQPYQAPNYNNVAATLMSA
jgi:hypothetical protein